MKLFFSGVAEVSLLSLGERAAALGIGRAGGGGRGPDWLSVSSPPGPHDIYGSDQSIF